MAYVYDVLLNLNSELIDFYEWCDTDNIKYVRKIPLFRVNHNVMHDLLHYEVFVDSTFVEGLKGQTSFYNNFDKGYDYLCLFSDGYFVLGVKFYQSKIELVSRMQLDEEEEVLKIVERIGYVSFGYEKGKSKDIFSGKFFTRNELLIKDRLLKEFSCLYHDKMFDVLSYYYYEYFNRKIENVDQMYQELVSSMENSIDHNHYLLYDVMNLSRQGEKEEIEVI